MVAYAKAAVQIPPELVTSYRNCFAITPTDNTQFTDGAGNTIFATGVYVGVAGDVTLCPVDAVNAGVVTFKNLPAGHILPVRCQGVNATGTTATNLIGLG